MSRSPSPSWSKRATPPVVLSTISFFSGLPLTMGVVSPDSPATSTKRGNPSPAAAERLEPGCSRVTRSPGEESAAAAAVPAPAAAVAARAIPQRVSFGEIDAALLLSMRWRRCLSPKGPGTSRGVAGTLGEWRLLRHRAQLENRRIRCRIRDLLRIAEASRRAATRRGNSWRMKVSSGIWPALRTDGSGAESVIPCGLPREADGRPHAGSSWRMKASSGIRPRGLKNRLPWLPNPESP